MSGKGKSPRPKPTHEEVARVCRMYRTNKDASKALGVNTNTFSALCAEYGLLTPWRMR